MFKKYTLLAAVGFCLVSSNAWCFVTFESGQVRPLAMSSDKSTLFAINTPDNSLEVFDVKVDGLSHRVSIPVGLEPVAVAVHTDNEVWVVNHLSDSVSVVDVTTGSERVIKTLLVGDEPRDIVFAGTGGNRAFISTAHRGQNSPYGPDLMPNDPGEITQEGAGRADVWVFNASNTGNDLGGSPLVILTHFTDTPRALAVSQDGSRVYVAGFHTGNKTAVISEGAICNGGETTASCNPGGGLQATGGLPSPTQNTAGSDAPEVGLIVKHNGSAWVDELGRNWNNQVRFNLPDRDVFVIDANASTPVEVGSFSGMGTVLFNMVTNPVTGMIYVSNTEANNHVRFEGERHSTTHSSVIGHQHEARITLIDPSAATPVAIARHLNKHIDYSVVPSPVGISERSLSMPMGMAISSDGNDLYLAAFGSSKVAVFDTGSLEDNAFVPDTANQITVTGGGPSGLVLDEEANRLYVLTRFNNSISVIDTITRTEVMSFSLHNPEPASVVNGRQFLYDASLSSSNGEASCGSCHVFGDLDSLAWDLGDPEGALLPNPNPFGPIGVPESYHPMKGPMTTQSLRGLLNQGPLHWRGDRTAGHSGGDPMDSAGAFKEFNVAFVGLLGRSTQLTTNQMDSFTDFVMQISYPPNPNRPLDNSMTLRQAAGANFFFNERSTAGFLTCNDCHVIDPSAGHFGSDGLMSFEGETQNFKIPHLRNMYQKVGMFGMPRNDAIIPGDDIHMGDQIRGFGFIHDGSVDTLFRFHGTGLFSFSGGDTQRREVEQFMHAMDSSLAPIVGQQITLNSENISVVSSRIDLLIQRAAAGEADLVVKGIVAGEKRGWIRLSNGEFSSDKLSEVNLTEIQLRNLANTANQELTFLAVPPGSGHRIAVDRDLDGVLDGDDLCPAVSSSNQIDTDGDGIGDACDNCIIHANLSQHDSNGDGFGNRCDADLNNDNIVNALDLGLLRRAYFSSDQDADLNADGIVNALDLGLFRQFYFSAPGPSYLH